MIGSQGVISLVTKDAKIDLVFSPDPRAEGQRIILRRSCGRWVKGEEAAPPGFRKI